jgi:hypothetical protein
VLIQLKATDARTYIRRLLEEGVFVVSDHARREMNKDDLGDADAINILRGGSSARPSGRTDRGGTAWIPHACAS